MDIHCIISTSKIDIGLRYRRFSLKINHTSVSIFKKVLIWSGEFTNLFSYLHSILNLRYSPFYCVYKTSLKRDNINNFYLFVPDQGTVKKKGEFAHLEVVFIN